MPFLLLGSELGQTPILHGRDVARRGSEWLLIVLPCRIVDGKKDWSGGSRLYSSEVRVKIFAATYYGNLVDVMGFCVLTLLRCTCLVALN